MEFQARVVEKMSVADRATERLLCPRARCVYRREREGEQSVTVRWWKNGEPQRCASCFRVSAEFIGDEGFGRRMELFGRL